MRINRDIGEAASSMLRFSMLEVEAAPESPGLYAWYVRPQMGTFIGGQDAEASAAFISALQRYALLYEPPPVDLRGPRFMGCDGVGTFVSITPLQCLESSSMYMNR